MGFNQMWSGSDMNTYFSLIVVPCNHCTNADGRFNTTYLQSKARAASCCQLASLTNIHTANPEIEPSKQQVSGLEEIFMLIIDVRWYRPPFLLDWPTIGKIRSFLL